MDCHPVSSDPAVIDKEFFPDVLGLTITNPTTGERMSTSLFTPQGRGPHPTILLLHGFPGYEPNMDLAHAFQRAGYTTMVFHYRGSWGSEGTFSLCHVLEDVSVAIDYIRENAATEEYRLDPERLLLMGHSMGGFAALVTASQNPYLLGTASFSAFDFALASTIPELREAVRAEFTTNLPINRIPLDDFMAEIDDHRDLWIFPALAAGLAKKPLYLIAGTREMISMPQLHLEPLREALAAIPGAEVSVDLLDVEHCYSDRRLELTVKLLAWVDRVISR